MKNNIPYMASLGALSTLFLIIGFYINIFDLFAYFLSCIVLGIISLRCNVKDLIISHVVVSLAGLILCGFYYFYIIGYFLLGFVIIADKFNIKGREILKYLLFILAFYIYMLFVGEALSINEQIDEFIEIIVIVLAIISYPIFKRAYQIIFYKLKERIMK